MYISKKLRQEIYQKFDGKCAYSGTPLEDDWQVEHIEPQIHFEIGVSKGDPHHIKNLVPVQRIINHYKRGLSLKDFRNWYLGELHERLQKLPKNPKAKRSINRKEYLLKVAAYFNITPDDPFTGKFYFESL